MSLDAKATILYGVCFKHGTPEYERLNTMDWTPIEELEKTSPVRFEIQGDLEAPVAYVVGVPVNELHSWAEGPSPVKINEWQGVFAKILNKHGVVMGVDVIYEALYAIGLKPIPFEWYLVVHVG